MWVGTEFPRDTNKALKDVQSRLYGEMLLRLYSRPRDRYLTSCRLVQIDTDLANRLRSMDGFAHRTLQDIHDLIAAWFRFSRDDGGQLRLCETDEAYQDRLAAEWRTFFERKSAASVPTMKLRAPFSRRRRSGTPTEGMLPKPNCARF